MNSYKTETKMRFGTDRRGGSTAMEAETGVMQSQARIARTQ